VAALRLLIDVNKSKFKMFQDGPAFMEINRLQGEMERIKRDYLKDNSFRPFVKPASIYDEEHKRNCNLPHIDDVNGDDDDDDKKTLVNARGIPYRIEKIDDDSSQSQELEKEDEDEDNEDSPAADHEDE
jgi:hypothetical protein